jgi:hypothetical protein
MNPDSNLPPSDSEIDRLLAGRLKRTSPELELRWRELRGKLAGRHPTRRSKWSHWLLWPGLAAGAFVAVALVFTVSNPPQPDPRYDLVAFEELIALDTLLAPAMVMLESENRDALLHLPSTSHL